MMGKPVPLPLIVVGVDLLEPSVGGENVGFAVTVDVGDADAVAVLLLASEVVDARLVLAEVDPDDTGAVVVGEGEVGLAVSIDIEECSALGVVTVSDLFRLPHGARGCRLRSGVVIHPDAIGYPAGSDEVGQAVVVNVDDPLAAVRDEFAVGADGAELVLFPYAAIGAGVLVPVGSAEQIGVAVAIHVEQRDALGVVVAETMREKGYAWLSAGSVAGMLHAEFGGVGGVLGVGERSEEE
jgi:hypothetical protein